MTTELRERVLGASGHLLVTGGPGSGKTTLALSKALQRIEIGLGVGQSVLFLSFSRAAVARVWELSQRSTETSDWNHLRIETFHSFFWHILRAHAYLLGAPRAVRLMTPADERVEKSRVGGTAWQEHQEWLLREKGLACFDLFAPKAFELLSRASSLCRLYCDLHPLLIVDEAQDTLRDQWACLRLLARHSQVMCLADLEQQIYNYRPDVSAQRVNDIVAELRPVTVDLGAANHRSAGGEILEFGNDVLNGTPRGSPYRGVSQVEYYGRATQRDTAIRRGLGILRSRIAGETKAPAESIAVLCSWNRGVAVVSRALAGSSGSTSIRHRAYVDDVEVALADRVLLFVLEPKCSGGENGDACRCLQLLSEWLRGGNGCAKEKTATAERLEAQYRQVQEGISIRRNSTASAAIELVVQASKETWTGRPDVDWCRAKELLRSSSARVVREVADAASDVSVTLRGHAIQSALARLWLGAGDYRAATARVEPALAGVELGVDDGGFRGVNVMTLHKAKGKEFDGVLIVDDVRNCPLTSQRQPLDQARRVLRVGISRARHHVLLVTDATKPTPLLAGHRLTGRRT